MTFKLYTDKSSIRKKNSRYVQGGESSVGEKFIRWWERTVYDKNVVTDVEYTIPIYYAGKPDLIANDYYGRQELGWLVLQYNNIVDINEELAVGKTIKLPASSRVFYEMLNKSTSTQRSNT
jgi:hypothetical protein